MRKERKNSLQKGERKGKPQAVTRLANNEMMNQKEMKNNHLRKSFSDKGDLMIVLLLFLQKQNLAFAVYQFGSVLSLSD